MLKTLFLLLGVLASFGAMMWLGPIFLTACFLIALGFMLTSVQRDPRDELVRTPTLASTRTSYFADL